MSSTCPATQPSPRLPRAGRREAGSLPRAEVIATALYERCPPSSARPAQGAWHSEGAEDQPRCKHEQSRAEQDLDRVFKEFQQVDSPTSRQQRGTGLGLALTRRFAILHGGGVRVESVLGTGSRFILDLPIEARSPDRAPRLPHDGAVDASLPLVIVVEDDPAAAELLARQIEGAGFRTQIARTGADVVNMARAGRPVAITLDILLPDVDGWEVLARLKRDETTCDIPVIVVSIVDDPQHGEELGALDYFVKPVDAKQLVDRLSSINPAHKSADGPVDLLAQLQIILDKMEVEV